jgi:hypothetical protein
LVAKPVVHAVPVSDVQSAALPQVRVQTLTSEDLRRVVSIFHAPDAETLRRLETNAKIPPEQIWAARRSS